MDDHQSSSSSDDDNEYIEQEEPLEFNIKCLFCNYHATNYQQMFNEHIHDDHQINLLDICRRQQMETFDFIKLVNYVRKQQTPASNVESIVVDRLFDHDEYLKPTMEDDHFLMFGLF